MLLTGLKTHQVGVVRSQVVLTEVEVQIAARENNLVPLRYHLALDAGDEQFFGEHGMALDVLILKAFLLQVVRDIGHQ